MKKTILFAAFAVLVAGGARWHYSRVSASMAISPIEKQSLHDAPNDGDTMASDGATGGILGRIADLKRSAASTASALKEKLPGQSDESGDSGKSEIDLSGEWLDGSRNQGFIGSCHIYATAAVVEAALFRAHGRKVHINESDLFLNSKVISPTKSNDPAKSNDLFGSYCNGSSCSLDEGGYPQDDIQYLFKNGASLVTNENPALRDDFGDAWSNYESAVTQSLSADNDHIATAMVEKNLPDDQYTAQKIRSQFADDQRKAPQIDAMNDIIKSQAGGKDPAAMRLDLRKQMAGLRLYVKELTPIMDALGVPGAPKGMCAKSDQGKDVMNAIDEELKARVPVGIAMNLQALKEWGVDKSEGIALHAIVIDGMQRKMFGKVEYTTRNSWGHNEIVSPKRPNNPPLTEDQVCRIIQLYVVLAPGESAPSGFNLIATAARPAANSVMAAPPAPPSPTAPPLPAVPPHS